MAACSSTMLQASTCHPMWPWCGMHLEPMTTATGGWRRRWRPWGHTRCACCALVVHFGPLVALS